MARRLLGGILWLYPVWVVLYLRTSGSPRTTGPIHLERLYPVLVGGFFWLVFMRAWVGRTFPFLAVVRRIRPLSDAEVARLNRSGAFWGLGLGLNTAILAAFLFGGSDATWASYATFGSYVLMGLITAAQIAWVSGPRALLGELRRGGEALLAALNHSYNFSIFGLMCLVGAPLFWLLWLLMRLTGGWERTYRRIVRWACHHSFRFVVWHTRRFGLIDIRFEDASGGRASPLVVCNHLCMFDIVAIFSRFPGCLTFVNRKFLYNPLLRPIIAASGHIPISVGDAGSQWEAFCRAEKILAQGTPLVVFPEGTRSRDGRLCPLKPGVFRLAIETGTDITPVFFTMNRPFLKGGPMFTWNLTTIRLTGWIMPPIPVAEFLGEGPRRGAERLGEEFRRRYEAFCHTDRAGDWTRLPATEWRTA